MNLNRHVRTRSRQGGVRLLVVSAVAVLASTLGLVALSPAAEAASPSNSEVTVAWRGGNSPDLQRYQVDHQELLSNPDGADAGTGHWDDFKDLEVTVSQTQGLRDQAVTVTATGMAPTSFVSGERGLTVPERSFLQVFQCWGPDPLADDFAETCQYGAWSAYATLGKSSATVQSVLGDVDLQGRGGLSMENVPFRSVTNEKSIIANTGPAGEQQDGTAAFFDASTSNEQPIVYVDEAGSARTSFAVQTFATQPYLGCGNKQLAGTRCWLVVVPRGAHSTELPSSTGLDCVSATWGGRPSGQTLYRQLGSPLTPSCNAFDNRIVVPLDFAEPTSGCAPGAPETRVLGSELVAEAMSSWQRGLCAEDGLAYSLTTNSGDVTRAQLLSGQANVAIVANPFTASNVGESGEGLLADAELAYAPVANAALTVSFVAGDIGTVGYDPTVRVTTWRDLKITPRLLAKVLTQSYRRDAPFVIGHTFDVDPLAGNPQIMAGTQEGDPEWRALGNPALVSGTAGGTFVVSGPQGEDVVALLWRYIQSDADAAAFLRGEPDPWGMTVNPYYLPSTDPDALGGGLPYDLAVDPIDTFPRADSRVVPDLATAQERYRGIQVDSVSMMPYSGSLSANAGRILRGDLKRTDEWDPNKEVTPGTPESPAIRGAWVPTLPQVGASRYAAGITDAASAARYAIDSMQLALPVSELTTKETVASSRTFVAPTEASISAAVSATAVDDRGLGEIDFRALPNDAYPVTATLYAVVNTASYDLDAESREQVATLLDYSSNQGNVRGAAPGQLPDGYASLTPGQVVQSAKVSAVLRSTGTDDTPPRAVEADPPRSAAGNAPAAAGAPVADAPAASTATTTAAADATTVASTAAVGGQAALGGALVAGMVGLGASPFLLRRRGSPV